MRKQRVMIVEDNRFFAENVRNFFLLKNIFEIACIAQDSAEAIARLPELNPDLVLLDLAMPQSDGFAFLEHNHRRRDTQKPQVIVVTSLCHDVAVRLACRLGAVYYMVKPICLEELHARCVQVAGIQVVLPDTIRHAQQEDENKRAGDILIEIGILSNSKGHLYMRKAFDMIRREPDLIYSLTTKLYPRIARECGTSAGNVERSIRYAIDAAHRSGRLMNINAILKVSIVSPRSKPSNGGLISLIAKRLQHPNARDNV